VLSFRFYVESQKPEIFFKNVGQGRERFPLARLYFSLPFLTISTISCVVIFALIDGTSKGDGVVKSPIYAPQELPLGCKLQRFFGNSAYYMYCLVPEKPLRLFIPLIFIGGYMSFFCLTRKSFKCRPVCLGGVRGGGVTSPAI
jgi:hypothetical protein